MIFEVFILPLSKAGLGNMSIIDDICNYDVYTPMDPNEIIIVALIRQTRDAPGILKTHSYKIRQELNEIFGR